MLSPDTEFRDRSAAMRHLAGLRQLVPTTVYELLVTFLRGIPDPESVLTQFERLVQTSGGEILALLEKHSALVHYAILVFGYSSWLGETLISNTDLFEVLVLPTSLNRTHSHDEFQSDLASLRSRSAQTDTAALLARFKRREYVRILLRDLLGIATLAETTAEISALSDLLIDEAVNELHSQLRAQYCNPQQPNGEGPVSNSGFAVLSLGKLGGNELNYSSDIDLLFLYQDKQAEEPISNREFFVKLAQQATELLSRHTREGPVFRIDLRLRPQGKEGELAVPLSYAIHYYSEVAQDWELQAMIKARHSAGDPVLARRFIRAVQPHIYRPELNFAAIKTALTSLERIGKHRKRHWVKRPAQREIDVKLDRGGIRDIEFLVQCLQRVYGGSESWLRSCGTLLALQKLHDKEHIRGADFQSLNAAYEFLRKLEHRLQLRHGQQAHRVSPSSESLRWLSQSVTRQGTMAPSSEEFLAEVEGRMAAVAEIYQRIVFQEQSRTEDEIAGFQSYLQPGIAQERHYGLLLQRLALESPYLHQIATRKGLSQHARRNLDRFLSSAGTTSERYSALLQAPEALERALLIFEDSQYLTDILVQYPTEVSVLEEPALNPRVTGESKPGPKREVFRNEASADRPLFNRAAWPALERAEAQAILRQTYRRCVLRSGARDLFHVRDVFESLEGSTLSADAAIQAAIQISRAPAGIAVLGLGRLGAREFDLLSDADVIFVRNEGSNAEDMQRMAERIMETLTAYTREGTVFPVDARLRPHGREGELVITPTQLLTYFESEAQSWEALTYLKLRFVAGDRELGERTVETSRKGIAGVARRTNFVQDLADMRARLERSDAQPSLKTGGGGAYDIDYLVGRMQARHQLWLAANLRERLRLVHEQGLLEASEYSALADAARMLRTTEHLVRLVTGRSHKWLPVAEHAHRSVQKLLGRRLTGETSIDPEESLVEALRRAKALYVKFMGP